MRACQPARSAEGCRMDISEICITRQSTLREALDVLDRSGLGVLLLVEGDRKFERTVTDGDLRRLLLDGASLDQTLVSISEHRSIVVPENRTRRDALGLMQEHTIDHL